MIAKKAVVIDFYGTLTPSTTSAQWDEHAARSAAPLGIPADVWRRALDSSFTERATGVLGDLPSTFRTLAERCGFAPTEEQLAESCRVRVEMQQTLFVFRDDVLESLAELRARGFRLGLLSDCTIELTMQWSALPVAEYFDAAVFSFEAGIRKPAPAFFESVVAKLGVEPEECLYVGDGGGQELTGSTKAGMTAVMLRAPDWYTNNADTREDDWAGEEVASFTELLTREDLASA